MNVLLRSLVSFHQFVSSLGVSFFKSLILFYQTFFSSQLGPSCRFYPSCSQYGKDSFEKHGVVVGLFLTVRRIIRCRPGGSFGFDPVPEKIKTFWFLPIVFKKNSEPGQTTVRGQHSSVGIGQVIAAHKKDNHESA